jgi:hypothetical protein
MRYDLKDIDDLLSFEPARLDCLVLAWCIAAASATCVQASSDAALGTAVTSILLAHEASTALMEGSLTASPSGAT